MSEKLKTLKTIRFILFFIIFLFTFILVVVTIILLVPKLFYSDEEVKESEFFVHRYYEYNEKTGEASSGLQWIMREEESAFSYEPSSGTYSLISNFDTTEYRCTGSCYCETERKSLGATSSHTLSKTLLFLVATVSSILAYERASEYFSEVCEVDHNEECLNQVSSVVDNCEEIKQAVVEEDMTDEQRIEQDKKEHYDCFGRCRPLHSLNSILRESDGYEEIPKDKRKMAEKIIKQRMLDFQCSQKDLSMLISVDEVLQPMYNEYGTNPEEKLQGDQLEGYYQTFRNIRYGNREGESAAIYYFVRNKFSKFCLDMIDEETQMTMCEPWKGCVSLIEKQFLPKLNPSVKCVKVQSQ